SATTEQHERRLAYGLHLGSRLPAHATSTGRVLLASMDDEALERWLRTHPLARLTAHTVTSVQQLLSMLYAIRQQDYCVAREEHELNVHAVAVPLRDRHGRTLAALNAVGNAQQLEKAST